MRVSREDLDKLTLAPDDPNWPLILCLHLTVLLNASRSDQPLPELVLECEDCACRLRLPADWLKVNPLSQAALDDELGDWARVAPTVRLTGVLAD